MGKAAVRIDLALALIALLCAAVSLGIGPAHLGWARSFAALAGQGDPNTQVVNKGQATQQLLKAPPSNNPNANATVPK